MKNPVGASMPADPRFDAIDEMLKLPDEVLAQMQRVFTAHRDYRAARLSVQQAAQALQDCETRRNKAGEALQGSLTRMMAVLDEV